MSSEFVGIYITKLTWIKNIVKLLAAEAYDVSTYPKVGCGGARFNPLGNGF